MKIVVIGGTGLIGTKVVAKLRQLGHQVIAASPATGINTITGEGLAEAMNNTDVVVDLANSPSFEDKAVMEFFQTAGRNLLAAEINAGVKHHVAVSIVGVDLMQDSGYMRAKKVQEDLIKAIRSALYHCPEHSVLRIPGRHCQSGYGRKRSAYIRCKIPADCCRRRCLLCSRSCAEGTCQRHNRDSRAGTFCYA